ncbi:hypothetical protein [Leucobacter sp. PH1c]|uniref:hypothetical protein n=1 Tax=Leucobacter sp. PH1c TaxID=1397278 RepID=UPI000469B01C|nr:hypothetical protein [Leucobacter sp. PH1c]
MSARNAVSIERGALVVIPRGMDKIWGFRRRIEVPLERITEVAVEPSPLRVPTGWRGPGLDVGGKLSGTFHPGGERHYWNVSGRGPALTVGIAGGQPFDRLTLSVADAEALCRELHAAGAARPSAE